MTNVATNNTPTEAQVTAQTQPTGLPPGDAGRQVNEADTNGQTGATVSKPLREAKRMVVPVDFDFAVDPEPRPNMDPMNPPAAQQQQNPQQQNPIDALADGIEVEFKGQKQKVSLDDARTMIQQFKSMSTMSPVYGVAKQIADTLGINDPRQVADLLKEAVMGHITKQQGNAPAAGNEPPASAQQQAQAAGLSMPAVPPEITPEVDAAVNAFFEQNGLTPTPEIREGMRFILAYGKHVKDVAQAFPQIAADVKMFKDAQQVNSQRALEDTVNARAAKVAAELGIDTQAEVDGFKAWVGEVAQTFPGFVPSIKSNPDAMEKAIRQYHVHAAGTKALTQQQTMRQNVTNDLSRAGGDAPGGRGANFAAPPKDDQKAFEQDMMSRM